MAKKKPAQRTARKKSVKKSGARIKAPRQKAATKKPPAMNVAVRVTKKNFNAIKPTSKSAPSRAASPLNSSQIVIVAATGPMPSQTAGQCLTDVPEPAAVAAWQPQNAKPISEDEIRHRAYLRWEAAGRPHGDGGHFWTEAERELLQQSADSSRSSRSHAIPATIRPV